MVFLPKSNPSKTDCTTSSFRLAGPRAVNVNRIPSCLFLFRHGLQNVLPLHVQPPALVRNDEMPFSPETLSGATSGIVGTEPSDRKNPQSFGYSRRFPWGYGSHT